MRMQVEWEGEEIYTDGGVVLVNPSPYAGTWAYKRVSPEGLLLKHNQGAIFPAELGKPANDPIVGTVSNNNAELWAMLEAIESLPFGWNGTVCSDSGLAIGWVFKNHECPSLPPVLAVWLQRMKNTGRLPWMRYRLLSGHPTKADLLAGVRVKKEPHYPVSIHNVWCDKKCGEIAEDVVAGRIIRRTEIDG